MITTSNKRKRLICWNIIRFSIIKETIHILIKYTINKEKKQFKL